MSNLKPKQFQTAYERYEMASFDHVQQEHLQPVINLELEEIERVTLREIARQKGYQDGLEEGRTAAMQSAMASIQVEKAHFREVILSFCSGISQAEESIAQNMLAFGLDLAKAMLKTALPVRPDVVLPIIREVMNCLPGKAEPCQLILHPDDAVLARQFLAEELSALSCSIVESNDMERGGCLIETPSNKIDGTNEQRWRRIAAALGHNQAWIDHA